MPKVVSCKLTVEQANRFGLLAEAQGGSKASLLRRLALDYLQSDGKVDAIVQSGRPRPPSGVDKGLPSGKTRSGDRLPLRKSPSSNTSSSSALPGEGLPIGYLPPFHRPEPPRNPISTLVEYSGLPSSVGVDAPPSVPLPTSRLPVYHTDAIGRPATSPKSSIGSLLLVGLFLWWLVGSRSKTAVDHTSLPHAQLPSRVDFGLPSHIAGNATVYNGRERLALTYL